MKKVLFVATVVKAHIMVFHIPFLKWFKENGYETYVCARNDYEKKEDCNIPYCDKFFDLPFERSPIKLNNLKTYQQLKEIIDNNDFDLIHCHTPTGGLLARLSSQKARKNGTKVIYTAHGFHFYNGAPLKNWLIYFPVEHLLSRCTDVIITINNEDYNRAKRSFKAANIKYIPGVGIDTKKYSGATIDKFEKRKVMGIPSNSVVLLSVGELNKNKNHEIVIRAIAKLKKADIHYVICGQGPLESNLRDLAEQLGVGNQIHFLGFRKDIAEICKVVDIFVFPSYREGLSVAMMEAMSSGLPIICSKVRGNEDLIEHERGGYLFNPNDLDSLVTYIKELACNHSLRREFGQYNVNISPKYSIENVEERMVDIYTNLD